MFRFLFTTLILLCATLPCRAAESVADCQLMLQTGKYEECRKATTEAITNRSYGEEWPILKAQSEMALGRDPEALVSIAAGIERYAWSVRLRLLEYECSLANGKKDQAAAALLETDRLVSTASWRYTDADDLVALGQVSLALGTDPKDVQEGFFERARKNYSNRPDGFLAAGRLALSKGDVALAAELLTPAAKTFPENPDILFLLSEAMRAADREQASALLQKTLEINPNHFPALLRIIEQQIDGEDYVDAEMSIQHLLAINPNHPDAHGLQSVIHHLRNDSAAAEGSRAAALKFSAANPKVDFLIGRKLSQKYRFAEGASFQRKALETDPNFADARTQLAQDLLRLGQETEGWQLAEEAHKSDGYNTTLFNLLKLKDSLNQFTTITSEHFQVRMETEEAAVYGRRVLELLEQAWTELTQRYEFTPELPVFVEIYPRADDFAVRTFGLPDVAGFLGVCFGRVITANSPATRRDNPTSWESILWHEFCHVVTLQKTGNRIPRWLSEGISVFEERRTDRRWGQQMDAEFRDRILQGNVTRVAELSSAFLTAKSGADLNFAYYESSMLVEHLVTMHGLTALNEILADLNAGVQINDALDRHTDGLEALEESFTAYLSEQARAFAIGAEFATAEFSDADLSSSETVRLFLEEHPASFSAMMVQASLLLQANKPDEAEPILKKMITLVPEDDSLNGPRRMLAEVYRRGNQPERETAVLTEHLLRSADDLEAAIRLQILSEEQRHQERVIELGRSIFAIDPFQSDAILRSVAAAESLGKADIAVGQLTSLLPLQPDDAARIHFRIGTLLKTSDPATSRRHVLLALEQAPRFREAHRLLLELTTAAVEPSVGN